jgi:hypothetical protein
LVFAICLFLGAPMMAVASAAAHPVSLGDWMRTIFASASRKIDPAQKGVGVAPPPIPAQQLQPSSEPAAPKQPATSMEGPRFWVDRESVRKRRSRR